MPLSVKALCKTLRATKTKFNWGNHYGSITSKPLFKCLPFRQALSDHLVCNGAPFIPFQFLPSSSTNK